MLKEPDELKWEGIATEHATQAQSRIAKMALSPVAKQQVDSDFSRWQIHRTGQVKVDSARQSFDKVTTKVKNQLMLNMERQDPEGFADNLSAVKKLGILMDEDIQIEKIKYAKRGEELKRKNQIEGFNKGVDAATAVAVGSGEAVAWVSGLCRRRLGAPEETRRGSAARSVARGAPRACAARAHALPPRPLTNCRLNM